MIVFCFLAALEKAGIEADPLKFKIADLSGPKNV